jgi:hypothetical protein
MFKPLLKLDLKSILLVVLVLIIVLMRSCEGGDSKPVTTVKIDGKKYEVVKHDIDTFIQKKETVVYKKGTDIYHDTTIYVPTPISFDTVQVVNDYYAKRVYTDTLKLADPYWVEHNRKVVAFQAESIKNVNEDEIIETNGHDYAFHAIES